MREEFGIHPFHDSPHPHEADANLYSPTWLPVADGPRRSIARVWLAYTFVAVSINVNADSQAMQLQNYSALGNSKAWGPDCLRLAGVCMLGGEEEPKEIRKR